MDKEKHIYPWHNCLECKKLFSDDCPLDGKDAMEKLLNRTRKSDRFDCKRFLDEESPE